MVCHTRSHTTTARHLHMPARHRGGGREVQGARVTGANSLEFVGECFVMGHVLPALRPVPPRRWWPDGCHLLTFVLFFTNSLFIAAPGRASVHCQKHTGTGRELVGVRRPSEHLCASIASEAGRAAVAAFIFTFRLLGTAWRAAGWTMALLPGRGQPWGLGRGLGCAALSSAGILCRDGREGRHVGDRDG